MRKIFGTWALAAIVAFATVACTGSEEGEGKQLPAGEKTAVKLSFTLAPATATSIINNVWVLQWDAAGNNKVCYKERYHDMSTPLEATLTSGNDMKIAIIAGVTDGTLFQLGTTYDDFCKRGYPSKLTTDAQVPYSAFQQVNIKQANQEIALSMKWIAAKISFSVASSTAGYTLKSAQVKNVASTMLYLPNTGVAQTYGLGEVILAEFDKTYTYYISENMQGDESGITSAKDRVTTKKATFIEVSGTKNTSDKRITATYVGFYGNNDTNNFDVVRGNSYNQALAIDFDAQNDKRVSKVETSTDLTLAVVANCYMLSPTETTPLGIPVSRVNEFWVNTYEDTRYAINNGVNDGAITKWAAKIIWETTPELITFRTAEGTDANGYFAVLPNGGKTGSALVGLFDATKGGEIDVKTAKALWSWHIWVTDYNPGGDVNGLIPTVTGDPGRAAVTGGHVHYFKSLSANPTLDDSQAVIMDRDLGALANDPTNLKKSTGMYYQWGRKDPFYAVLHEDSAIPEGGYPLGDPEKGFVPGATDHIIFDVGPESMAKATQSPATYFNCANMPTTEAGYDWLQSGNDNDNLWAKPTNLKMKTIYDPCPAGWKVPHDTKTFESLMPRNVCEPSTFNPENEQANIDAGIADNWGYYNLYPVQGVVCWDNTTQFFSPNSGRINSFNGKLFVYSISNYGHLSTVASKKNVWVLFQHTQLGPNVKEGNGLIEIGVENRSAGCTVRCVKE